LISPPSPSAALAPAGTTEFVNEFDLKEKEIEWLDKVGRLLLAPGDRTRRAAAAEELLSLNSNGSHDGSKDGSGDDEAGGAAAAAVAASPAVEADARLRALRRWDQIKDIYDRRVARMHEDRLLARRLTQDLTTLRDWMKGLERRLSRPVAMRDTSEKEYKKKRKEYLVSDGGCLLADLITMHCFCDEERTSLLVGWLVVLACSSKGVKRAGKL